MSVSVRTRFEVFKRDRFCCRYCGGTPPKVLLEADHVVPRAAGGTDDEWNLVTSCQDCNRGKGATLLEEGTLKPLSSSRAEMEERLDQARAYTEFVASHEMVVDQQVAMVFDAWARRFDAEIVETEAGPKWSFADAEDPWPEEKSVRRFLRKLPLEFLLEAVDIAASRIRYPGRDAARYFYGVCHREIGKS